MIDMAHLLGVAGEKTSHNCCNRNDSGPEEQVDMVVHEHPCIARGLGISEHFPQTLKKIFGSSGK